MLYSKEKQFGYKISSPRRVTEIPLPAPSTDPRSSLFPCTDERSTDLRGARSKPLDCSSPTHSSSKQIFERSNIEGDTPPAVLYEAHAGATRSQPHLLLLSPPPPSTQIRDALSKSSLPLLHLCVARPLPLLYLQLPHRCSASIAPSLL